MVKNENLLTGDINLLNICISEFLKNEENFIVLEETVFALLPKKLVNRKEFSTIRNKRVMRSSISNSILQLESLTSIVKIQEQRKSFNLREKVLM